ncbi:MAG: hypothetical protein JEZ14_24680, partial [Marinilabiliaceae bacterium]|nr:hypothetical protein [Marinilabiliaceae bacterium]
GFQPRHWLHEPTIGTVSQGLHPIMAAPYIRCPGRILLKEQQVLQNGYNRLQNNYIIRHRVAITFKVSRHAYMQWFEISDVGGPNNSRPSYAATTLMAQYIAHPKNQCFFLQNARDTGQLLSYYRDRKIPYLKQSFDLDQVQHQGINFESSVLQVRDMTVAPLHKASDTLFKEPSSNGSSHSSIADLSSSPHLELLLQDDILEMNLNVEHLLAKCDTSSLLNELSRRQSKAALQDYSFQLLKRWMNEKCELAPTSSEVPYLELYEKEFRHCLAGSMSYPYLRMTGVLMFHGYYFNSMNRLLLIKPERF